MNKQQEQLAVKLIAFIKQNNGFVTASEVNNSTIGKLFDFKTDMVVFNALEELKLIGITSKHSFRLTEKGWKFKSFKKLNLQNKLKSISTLTIIITAIITVIINLLQIIL